MKFENFLKQDLLKHITPLFILIVVLLVVATNSFINPSTGEYSLGPMEGILILAFCVPFMIVNWVLNLLIKKRALNLTIQSIIVVVVAIVALLEVWV